MSGIMNSLSGIASNLGGKFMSILNKILPPEKRAEIFAKLQDFAINNPKLAAFLTTQIVLTGFPLVLFLAFSLTTFLVSLLAALVIGLLAAVLFTLFMVGVALLVVLPTIFLTTFAASFIFLWGLGGYYLLKWFNEGDMPAPDGTAIGDKLNSLTGGRLSWLTDGAKKTQERIASGVDQAPKVDGGKVSGGQQNGSAEKKSEENGSAKSSGTDHGKEDGGKEGGVKERTTTKQGDDSHKKPPKLASGEHTVTNSSKTAAGGGSG